MYINNQIRILLVTSLFFILILNLKGLEVDRILKVWTLLLDPYDQWLKAS